MKKTFFAIVLILALMLSSSCHGSENPSSDVKNVQESINERYNDLNNNQSLSLVDKGNGITSLAKEWDGIAEQNYRILKKAFQTNDIQWNVWNEISGGAIITLSDYWEARKNSDQSEIKLMESLITYKYQDGSIGGVEMARFKYQISKQKALDFESMVKYMTDSQ